MVTEAKVEALIFWGIQLKSNSLDINIYIYLYWDVVRVLYIDQPDPKPYCSSIRN